jgi:Tfp pilus assembly protein PilN
MSVRVNLLPQEQTARQTAARQRSGIIAGGVAVLAILGAVTVWQNGQVSDANDRLTAEEEILAGLQSDERQLDEFAELEQRSEESTELIVQAMGGEASVAGILQDVAAVMPSDAQLQSLSLSMEPPTAGDAGSADAADADSVEVRSGPQGTVIAVGKSLNNHAPGLEKLLLELDKVAGFHDLFFTSSVLEDPSDPYPTFTVEAQLGPEILTGRYDDGVPEGLR